MSRSSRRQSSRTTMMVAVLTVMETGAQYLIGPGFSHPSSCGFLRFHKLRAGTVWPDFVEAELFGEPLEFALEFFRHGTFEARFHLQQLKVAVELRKFAFSPDAAARAHAVDGIEIVRFGLRFPVFVLGEHGVWVAAVVFVIHLAADVSRRRHVLAVFFALDVVDDTPADGFGIAGLDGAQVIFDGFGGESVEAVKLGEALVLLFGEGFVGHRSSMILSMRERLSLCGGLGTVASRPRRSAVSTNRGTVVRNKPGLC